MHKVNKTRKHKCRIREVDEDVLNELYLKINHQCIDCVNDCKNYKSDCECCENRIQRESLNELIEMIQDEQIDLKKFVEDYNLKFNILLDMLKAKTILNYKYYTCLAHRLRIYDEYEKYAERFKLEEEEVKNF